MKYLVILAAVVAVAMCDCDGLAREKVKSQWAHFYHDHKHMDIGTAVWRAFFKKAPEYRKFFDRVNGDDITSPAFQAHSARVLGGLDMVMSILDHEDIARAAIAHLKSQHVTRHIPRGAFSDFRTAMFEVVPAVLGRCFDEDAWNGCMNKIAAGIFGH